ncbi:hypothetical protein ACLOJK_012188 [Asimina triloba]
MAMALRLRTLSAKKTLATGGIRHLQTASLPELPFDYGALEPVISGEIMKLHHQKHHQTYVTNYNKALEQLDAALSKGDVVTVVALQSALKFNGGGFAFLPPPPLFLNSKNWVWYVELYVLPAYNFLCFVCRMHALQSMDSEFQVLARAAAVD